MDRDRAMMLSATNTTDSTTRIVEEYICRYQTTPSPATLRPMNR